MADQPPKSLEWGWADLWHGFNQYNGAASGSTQYDNSLNNQQCAQQGANGVASGCAQQGALPVRRQASSLEEALAWVLCATLSESERKLINHSLGNGGDLGRTTISLQISSTLLRESLSRIEHGCTE